MIEETMLKRRELTRVGNEKVRRDCKCGETQLHKYVKDGVFYYRCGYCLTIYKEES